mgnify:CR=1 FL=1
MVDHDPLKTTAALNDMNKVEKYTISDEAYDKRKGTPSQYGGLMTTARLNGSGPPDTFRAFKRNVLKDQVAKEEEAKERKAAQEEKETALGGTIKAGSRCQIDGASADPKRGLVAYVGKRWSSTCSLPRLCVV